MRLAGKVAIVTGSSRGIGKAIALALAKNGADVVVAARTEQAKDGLPGTIAETGDAIRALGRRALAVRCNVAEEDDVDQMVRHAVEEFGRIDILVNNAGLGVYQSFMEMSVKLWDVVMRVNVRGPFLCCRAAVPHMIRGGSGSIINISSPASDTISSELTASGKVALPSLVYGCSKAALERFTCGLAAEVAEHNIAVNALKPIVPTISEGMLFWNRGADTGAWLSPDAFMTKGAVFLARQDARGVTGQVFDDQELCRQYGLE